jgi:hypothetical protein
MFVAAPRIQGGLAYPSFRYKCGMAGEQSCTQWCRGDPADEMAGDQS